MSLVDAKISRGRLAFGPLEYPASFVTAGVASSSLHSDEQPVMPGAGHVAVVSIMFGDFEDVALARFAASRVMEEIQQKLWPEQKSVSA